jgi:hypothetical protein
MAERKLRHCLAPLGTAIQKHEIKGAFPLAE